MYTEALVEPTLPSEQELDQVPSQASSMQPTATPSERAPQQPLVSQQTVNRLLSKDPRASEAAFDEVVDAFEPRLINFARRKVDSSLTAEEVVQDALFGFWRNRGKFEGGPQDLTSYLYKAVHNRSMTAISKYIRRQDFMDPRARLAYDPDSTTLNKASNMGDPVVRQDFRNNLAAMQGRLPEAQWGVIRLILIGYSIGEIAALQGMTIQSVKARLFRGREEAEDILSGKPPMPKQKGRRIKSNKQQEAPNT